MKNQVVILASGSPRRRELLEMIGLEFKVMVSNQEESYTSTKPKEIVKELALKKARHIVGEVLESCPQDEEVLIIGADTIVVVDDQVLEKPEDEKEAFEMIHQLQNNMHQVYTGVALLKTSHALREWRTKDQEEEEQKTSEWFQRKNFVVETKVFVNPMTDDEIWEYIKKGESLDKAGGYGIQGGFAKFIEKIDGDFYNVMGLPVARLYREMKELL